MRKTIDSTFKPDIVLNINANYNYEVIDKNIIEMLRDRKIKLTTWYYVSLPKLKYFINSLSNKQKNIKAIAIFW